MTPYSKEDGWNIVALGRWAGIVVVASSLVLGGYDFFWTTRELEAVPFQRKFRFFWQTFLTLGAPGMIIFLLAELIDRVTWDDDGEEGADSNGRDSAE